MQLTCCVVLQKTGSTCQAVSFTVMLRVNLLFDSSDGFTIPNVTKRNQRDRYSYLVFQALSGLVTSVSSLMLLNPEPSLVEVCGYSLRWNIGSILVSNTKTPGSAGRKEIWVLVPALPLTI